MRYGVSKIARDTGLMMVMCAMVTIVAMWACQRLPAALSNSVDFATTSPFASGGRPCLGTSVTPAAEPDTGGETVHSQTAVITSQPEAAQTQAQIKGINDKYFSIKGVFHAGTAQVAVMLKSHVSFFTNQSFASAGVKGSLKNHIEFWKSTVKASTFVVDTLEKGYVIPLFE